MKYQPIPRTKEHYFSHLPVLLLLLLVFLAAIKWFTHRVFFDEGVYSSIANFLASGGQQGYFETLRPLALPTILVPFQLLTQVLPISPLIVGRIITLLLIVGSASLLYHLLKNYSSQKTALWFLFLTLTSTLVFMHTGYILTDVVAYLLGTSALIATLARRYYLAAAVLGLAFLFKFPLLLVGLPCLILFIIQQRKETARTIVKRILIAATILLLTIAPFLLFNLINYEGSLVQRITLPFTQASSIIGQESWIYESASVGKYLVALAGYEPVLVSCCLLVLPFIWKTHRKEVLALLGTALLFLLYFSLHVPRYDPRYLLALVPFLLVLAAIGLSSVNFSRLVRNIIIAAGCVSIIIVATHTMLEDYEHTPQLAGSLAAFSSYQGYAPQPGTPPPTPILLTSNPTVLLYFTGKGEVVDGQNPGELYGQYQRREEVKWLALDLSQYRCPQQPEELYTICEQQRLQTLSYFLSQNYAYSCGYLHGFPIILLSKETSFALSPQECAARLHLQLPVSPQLSVEMRVNEIVINEQGEIENRENIERAITKLNQQNLSTTIVITATNVPFSPTTNQFFNQLISNLNIGVLAMPGVDLEQFINRFQTEIKRPITTLVPYGDDWANYDQSLSFPTSFPKSITSCSQGAWLQTMPPTALSCEKVDLYTTKDWAAKQNFPLQELEQNFEIQLQHDPQIIIDIWAPALSDSQTHDIESFIEMIALRLAAS